jgi:hypothetical protein
LLAGRARIVLPDARLPLCLRGEAGVLTAEPVDLGEEIPFVRFTVPHAGRENLRVGEARFGTEKTS